MRTKNNSKPHLIALINCQQTRFKQERTTRHGIVLLTVDGGHRRGWLRRHAAAQGQCSFGHGAVCRRVARSVVVVDDVYARRMQRKRVASRRERRGQAVEHTGTVVVARRGVDVGH